jgi:hypothetical protein
MKGLLIAAYAAFLLILSISCVPISSQTAMTPAPNLMSDFTWELTRGVRLLLATNCCDSPTTEELVRAYIPEVQLWGDGRFLWTEQDEEGVRQVFVARLATDEVQALMQAVGSAGFFEWREEYVGEPVVDGISTCLTVTTVYQEKTVCETHGGAPVAFYTLFDRLSQGAGYSGAPFHPDRAFVTGFRLENLVGPRPPVALTWEETRSRLPVSHVLSGIWLEDGQTLRLLWDAANHDPYRMAVVDDGDNLYRLILQVPGVSWIEP